MENPAVLKATQGEMAMKKKAMFWLSLALFATATILAGIQHDGPYSGKVVDAETGQPIEGAAVLGIRQLVVWGWIELQLKYFDASEATTDKEGRFEVPSVTGLYWRPFGHLTKTEFTIFKPGYDCYRSNQLKPVIDGIEKKGSSQLNSNTMKLKKISNIKERIRVLREIEYPLFAYADEKISEKARSLVVLVRNERKCLGMPEGEAK